MTALGPRSTIKPRAKEALSPRQTEFRAGVTCERQHEALEALLVLAQLDEQQPPQRRVEGRAAPHVVHRRARAVDAQEREVLALKCTRRVRRCSLWRLEKQLCCSRV